MANYRRLLSEKDFLKVQLRARAVWKNGTTLLAIYYKQNELVFQTRSATEPNIIYTERVQFTDLSIEKILAAKKFRDIENMIKDSELKIYCSCPAFLYWGYKYMAWKHGYGIEKETRRPVIRNPYERGYVCKHLYAIMQILPILARPVAAKFKKYAQTKAEVEGGTPKTSNYFGSKKVRTDLSKNETVSLKDSADNINVIDDEPLITMDDIVNNNIEVVQPMFDTSDVLPAGPVVGSKDMPSSPIIDSGDVVSLSSGNGFKLSE